MIKTFTLVLGIIMGSVSFAQDSIRISLAEWTFDKWFGGGVLPEGQTADKPVPADRGTLAATARIGTEQMFSGGTVVRVWSVPTTGGYVRCSRNWVAGSADLYFMITGLNTVGASSICLTSSHATSSSGQPYSLKAQYRLSSAGIWHDLFGPFPVTDVTESGISKKQVNNVQLPAECENLSYIDIRWLCTSFPPSSSTQFRLDNIYLTANVKNTDPGADKTPLVKAGALHETDWTVPGWTKFQTAFKTATNTPVTANLKALTDAMNALLPKEMPYCINASFNGDPKTNMGFAWYTNAGETGGQVEIVAKENASPDDFVTPLMTIDATNTGLPNVNYIVTSNDPAFTAGMPANTKRSYVSHKAMATGLTPNTIYSYRVGKTGAWSQIRSFRTAENGKEEFSFIYITDTQANSNDNFDCSSSTLTEAFNTATNPLFVLMTGDFAESQGSSNSEWEYEQFFERMQNVWSRLPVVSTIGNHDASLSSNFFNHINNDVTYNQAAAVKTTMNGTVYSFVAGNALFMVANHEDVTKPGYLASLETWMTEQVMAKPDVRWRIVCVHSGLFSGGANQADSTNVTLRNELLPYYQKLKIDLSIQGHDHVYNVIGPVDNATKTVVPGAFQKVGAATLAVPSNMNGKSGGIFDVSLGTLYFINNSASRKKYTPVSQSTMTTNESITEVPNYWNLFTGRFGQTGEPTFSHIRVTTDTIFISTYAINNLGKSYLFDQIKITKEPASGASRILREKSRIGLKCSKNQIMVSGAEAQRIELFDIKGQLIAMERNSARLSMASVKSGIYIVRIHCQGDVYNTKIVH